MILLQDGKTGDWRALLVKNGTLLLVKALTAPVIIAAELTPNPAVAGNRVFVSVAAADIKSIPSTAVYTSGEFTSGEV